MFFPYYYFSQFLMHFYMIYIIKFISISFPCPTQYIYNNTNAIRVIKSMQVYLRTHCDPLSILNYGDL